MRRLLLVAYLICTSLDMYAQSDLYSRYNNSTLNISSGLPTNFIDDIYQDSFGFMWISTRGGGLVRYDGFNFISLGCGSSGISLRSNSCQNVQEDHFKRLWIAFEEFCDVLDLKTMQLVTPEFASKSLESRYQEIRKEGSVRVYQDSRKNMWVVTKQHLHRFSFDKEGVVTSILSQKCITTFPDVAIRDLFHDGNVTIGTSGHVYKAIVSNNKIQLKDLSSTFPQISGLFITDVINWQGEVWVATNFGLMCGGPNKEIYRHSLTDNTSIAHNFVSCLSISPEGNLLIGTLGGVELLKRHSKEFIHWNTDTPNHPIGSNFINCIYVKDGHIWVGTETGGISHTYPRMLALYNYRHDPMNPGSLSPNAVNAMFVETNGTLWVGNVEGGLSWKPKDSNVFTHYTDHNSSLNYNCVSTLTGDNRNRLWIGTWGGGVSVMDLAHPGQIIPLQIPEPIRTKTLFVGSLAYDPINDGMWIGSNDGLFFYNFRTSQLEKPFRNCMTIHGCIGSLVSHNGTLYVGSSEGMVKVFLKSRPSGHGEFRWLAYKYKLDDPESHIIEKITSFCQGRDGTLWLGSNGYGLYKQMFDKNGKEYYVNYSVKDGLSNNSVKGIVEDEKGVLWITTTHGLSTYNVKENVFSNFNESDGLLYPQYYWNSAVKASDGTIYLGSERGLTAVYGEDDKNLDIANLRFTQLTVDNELALAGSEYLDTDIALAKEINLHESNRSFTLSFSALNYGGTTQGTYYYRMSGYENEWIRLEPGEHSVRYSTLPSGNYTFEVKYIPSSSNLGTHTASININVSPFFWKSWWFLLLLFMAMGYGVYRLYRRRMDELHQLEVERLYSPLKTALAESEDPEKLSERIKGILRAQKMFDDRQQHHVDAPLPVADDRPFMEVLMDVMAASYRDSDFGVAQLCEKMNMSRVVLNRHLASETGYGASQFIRHYRLNLAKRLLTDDKVRHNITEVAYQVGFNDPKYFTRCFTKEYGVAPSSLIRRDGGSVAVEEPGGNDDGQPVEEQS